jgi:hypothetical protein
MVAALAPVGCAGSEIRADDTACEVFALLECETQVLSLAERVTGTTFELVYASDRVPGRPTAAAWDARSYGLGGWTLSAHHRFDPERGILFLGDGRTLRVGEGIRFDDSKPTGLLVAAEDGSEVYLFDADGRHLRTLDALTGAVRFEFAYDDTGQLTGAARRHRFDIGIHGRDSPRLTASSSNIATPGA